MLSSGHLEPLRSVPYFWTTIFGKNIRYAGTIAGIFRFAESSLDLVQFFSRSFFLLILITFVGYCESFDDVMITGDLENGRWVAFYLK